MNGTGAFTVRVQPTESGERLDIFLARHLTECSRSMIAGLIRDAHVWVSGSTVKPSYRVRADDDIRVRIPPPRPLDCSPEPIPIAVLFEDAHLLVIDKPAGMVVHPAPGNPTGTLVNALLYRRPAVGTIGNVIRPGIVHRLDKDTTGTLVVAKTDRAHRDLTEQFKSRRVRKTYLALVSGQPKADAGTVRLPIGRHPVDRKRMSTKSRSGREALTLWRVRERLPGAALLEVDIRTGRTHQIRVHMAAEGHPVAGDTVYGRRRTAVRQGGTGTSAAGLIASAPRQMLHALHLELTHPETGESMVFTAPVPGDLQGLINALRGL